MKVQDQSSKIMAVALVATFLSTQVLADNGTELKANSAKEEKPSVVFDGVLMLEASQFDGVYGDGDTQTEVQVRRATFGLSAELSSTVELEVSAKLEDGLKEADFKDALLGWEFAKSQRLIIGKQKEPVGLENNQSSKQIASIERSMASTLFTPSRNIGLLYQNKQSRHSVAIGVFEADHDSDDAGLAFSGRATAAIVKDIVQTVHIGASASHRDLGGTSLKLKDEGGVNSAENIVTSSRFDVDNMQTVGLEGAWLRGPITVQAEWYQSSLQLTANESAKDPSYSGRYIQGSWLFGKAYRKYKNGSMKLSGLKGTRAWEAVVRAENADLEDEEGGSQADTLMLGLNYYHGKHIRVMGSLLQANVVEAGEDDTSGNAGTIRFQYVF